MAPKEVAGGVASDLPQSVEELRGELRHEIDNAMKEMGQRFHAGFMELYALLSDLRGAQGIKTEPMTQRDDVPDASNLRMRKPDPESEPGEEEERQPEPEPEAEADEEEGDIVSFAQPAGNGASFKGKLPEYNGDVPWEDYRAQMLVIKEARGWSNKETALQLAASLRGPAVTVMSSVSEGGQVNYVFLTKALERRFGKSFGPEVYRARLKARFRKQGEPLSHLAQDIEDLARKAFPALAKIPMGVDDIAVTYFVDAINDRQLQLHVLQARPRSVNQALTIALEMESFMQTAVREEADCNRAAEGKNQPWRPRHSEGSHGAPVKRARPARPPSESPQAVGREGPFQGVCWGCGERGHRKSQCPRVQLLRGNVNTTPRGVTSQCGQGRAIPLQLCLAGAPMERVGVDITGPFPTTSSGNRFILVAMDYFTKWPEAYAIPNHEATTVARVLVDGFFSRFGVPKELHSDQGREFESRVFGETCRLLGINKTRTTPLRPQSAGLVERFNKTLSQGLAKYCSSHQRDWDEHLSTLLMAYRSAVHETTTYKPAELMLGRDLRLPVDLATGRPPEDTPTSINVPFSQSLQNRLITAHAHARGQMRAAGYEMKARYDMRAEEPVYRVGDQVWLYNPRRKQGLSPKLQSPWEGPWKVIEALTDVTFRIRRGPRQHSRVVHADRLWAYHGRGSYTWDDEDGPPDQASQGEEGDDAPDALRHAGDAPMTQGGDGEADALGHARDAPMTQGGDRQPARRE